MLYCLADGCHNRDDHSFKSISFHGLPVKDPLQSTKTGQF